MRKLFLLFGLLISMFLNAQPVIVFTTIGSDAVGDAEFSISSTKKVRFTRGNLLYQPSTKTWRIAPRQYDFVGGDNKTSTIPNGRHGTIWENGVRCSNTTGNHVKDYTGWLDVFYWGTSGWYGDDPGEDDTMNFTWRKTHNPNNKITSNPYSYITGIDSVCMLLGNDHNQGFTGAYALSDWGIRNNEALGGTADSMFRTPTKEEFAYLLTERANATSLSARAHIRLSGHGTAPDTLVNGLILFPDDWNPYVLPEKRVITDAEGNELYENNELTVEEWNVLEANGAIFLPATGSTSKYNRSGFYWTSTSHRNNNAWNVEFGGYGASGSDPHVQGATKVSHRAVRLVVEITTHETPEPPVDRACAEYEKVEVPGTGGTILNTQDDVDECSWKLKAVPSSNYQFAHWIDLHGNKTFDDSVDITIDHEVKSIVMEAVFVKSNSYVHEWLEDSIVYMADTSDVLNNLGSGSSDRYSNSNVVSKAVYKSDFGVWKQETDESLLSNENASKRAHIVFYDNHSKATAIIDTIIPIMIVGDSLASEICLYGEKYVDVQVYGTLTIDQNTVINGMLDIHSGGKVVVQSGKTLEVNGIIMRGNGITKTWPQLVANGVIINHNSDTIYYDYTLNQHEYYPLSLPYTTKCSLVHNPMNGKPSSFLSYYYDTDTRSMGESAWREYDDAALGAEFVAGKGYTVYAVPMKWKGNRQNTAIMRFPMKANLGFGEAEKSVGIRCSLDGNNKAVDKNWNLIGNPYLAEFTIGSTNDTSKLSPGYYGLNPESGVYEIINGDNETPIRYVTYSLDGFRTYEQEMLKGYTMKPFNCYFVQAISGNSLTFSLLDRASSVPNRRYAIARYDDIEIGIILTQNERCDHTGILFGDYQNRYEINADLNKEFGNGQAMSLYSNSDYGTLSYQAIPYDKINRPVSIGYSNVELREAVISFDANRYDLPEIDALWLTDIALNKHVNLLVEDYRFIPLSTSENNRLFLSLEVTSEYDTPTSVDEEGEDISDKTIFSIFGYKMQNTNMNSGVYISVDSNGNSRKILIK